MGPLLRTPAVAAQVDLDRASSILAHEDEAILISPSAIRRFIFRSTESIEDGGRVALPELKGELFAVFAASSLIVAANSSDESAELCRISLREAARLDRLAPCQGVSARIMGRAEGGFWVKAKEGIALLSIDVEGVTLGPLLRLPWFARVATLRPSLAAALVGAEGAERWGAPRSENSAPPVIEVFDSPGTVFIGADETRAWSWPISSATTRVFRR
jgi:hypothetical protein